MNDALDSALSTARHEIKVVWPRSDLDVVGYWVRSHQAGFRIAFPDRWVNSLYFDDPELGTFLENLAGVTDRQKFRVRWYGDLAKPAPSALEIKQRRNALGWKRSFPLGDLPNLDGPGARGLLRELRTRLPIEARHYLDLHPCPVMLGRYLRSYWQSADGRVRVTLDRFCQAYDQTHRSSLNLRLRTPLPEVVVLEVKFAFVDADVGHAVLETLPRRSSRHSKYAVGVSLGKAG